MNALTNKVQLIGNVGIDPEIKHLENDKVVVKLSLATHYKYNGNEKVTWHNLVAWSNTAEIIHKYVKKGDRIAVEGRLDNRSYEDKEGIKRYVTEIIVREILLLSSKSAPNIEKAPK